MHSSSPNFSTLVSSDLHTVLPGFHPGHRITSYNVCYTKLLRPDKAARICASLKTHALRLAVGDFGTGYSSLIYLKRYAPDRVKIDKSFISEILVSDSDRALVAAIIQLVHSLKMQVVAEGVETAEQLALLQSMGCDVVQGFLCGHSMPPSHWAHIRFQLPHLEAS